MFVCCEYRSYKHLFPLYFNARNVFNFRIKYNNQLENILSVIKYRPKLNVHGERCRVSGYEGF